MNFFGDTGSILRSTLLKIEKIIRTKTAATPMSN